MKAEIYIEAIVNADDEDKAVDVLVAIAKELGIDRRYTTLTSRRDRLTDYKEAFKKTRAKINVDVPSLELLLEVRKEVSFAYNEFVDELSSNINEDKIEFGDEARKVVKGNAFMQVMSDEEIKGKVGKAVASLKEVVGTTESYKQWLNCHKVSYANWATYRSMLESWKLFTDYLAGAIRHEQNIKITDVK